MPLNREAILAHEFEPIEEAVDERDVMLYALSLGMGSDPLDAAELRYVCENGPRPLAVFPTMPAVLGHPGDWRSDPRLRITFSKIVAGSQRVQVHAPIVPGQTLRVLHQVIEVVDKGPDKGALIVLQRRLFDRATGTLLATTELTSFCRADGGCGGAAQPAWQPVPVPQRPPDRTVQMPMQPNAALWYRLNGDRNPLHSNPEVARAAGFERPILHGLCTFGMAAVGVMRGWECLQPDALCAFEARFSSPVYPGEKLAIELWERDEGVSFRVRVPARDKVALDHGFARFNPDYRVQPAQQVMEAQS